MLAFSSFGTAPLWAQPTASALGRSTLLEVPRAKIAPLTRADGS